MMQTKFETKSKRVKGLSFHKYRPWILASLHNGSIHLFDYRAQCLLDKFEDHNGPVRGVDFHETQPMFVSGGDDHLIKLWNYKAKKCMFTLQGHMDYVRTVQFHMELPWIVSSSDDQTVRVWNWQNRNQLAILTGHSHYVMCAKFHPEDTLIASCSLDQTIRIWDFFKLKELSMQKTGSRGQEIMSGTEVEVKHILDSHEKGVNWVSFHPTMKILASAADDKTIKLWRLSGNKHWEMDTLKGHTGNVSCVLFHPRMEILLSNSEDRTMRFWDMQRRLSIHTTRKDTDRYWIMAAHPTLNYFAAGYDQGMNVFKLERERHACVRVSSSLFFVKQKQLYLYDLSTRNKQVLAPIQTAGKQVLLNQPTCIYHNGFNQGGHDFILNFDIEGGQFVLLTFDKDLRQARCTLEKRGENALACIFISKDRICSLDSNSREVFVSSFDGSNSRKWPIVKKGLTKIDMIYPAPLGKILVAADDTLFLYDLSAKRVIHELSVSDVRRVQWNPSFSHCIVITKTSIYCLDRTLAVINQQKESSKIKSGCFDEQNSFVYSTSTHIKYMFLEGKTTGTFKSIDQPVYVAFFMRNTFYALTREGEMETYEVDNTDYLFKRALQQKNLAEVREILGRGQLCGRSIICYLKEQGYSEIALFFEKDTKQRYNLALQSGNIQVALEAAQELKEPQLFDKLAQSAISLGNYSIPERCYQETHSFDKLNFFYAVTGSASKLRKMQGVAASPAGDPTLRFNSSVLNADVEERVRTLMETGQLPLAYMTARAHNLSDMVEYIESEIMDSEEHDFSTIADETEKFLARSKALIPLRPLHLEDGQSYFTQWPMTNLRAEEAKKAEQMFQRKKFLDEKQADQQFFENNEFQSTNKEVDNILRTEGAEGSKPKAEEQKIKVDEANWDGEESLGSLDDEADAMPVSDTAAGGDNTTSGTPVEDPEIFVPPSPGADPYQTILRQNPTNAALNVAVGDFQKALELLKNQIAVGDFAPLKQLFVDCLTLNRVKLQTLPHGPLLDMKLKSTATLPLLPVSIQSLEDKMAKGIDLTTKGDFVGSLAVFRSLIQSTPLMAVFSQQEVHKVKALIRQAVEYVTAMRLELERQELRKSDGDVVRQLELACIFTLCGMKTEHKFLAYKSAFTLNYKASNFITASHFARQVIDLESSGIVSQELLTKYRKYFQACQQKGSNAHKLRFDPQDSVQVREIMAGYLCAGTLSHLEDNRSVATVKCPLDGSVFSRSAFEGQVCKTCELCSLGQDSLGLSIKLEAGAPPNEPMAASSNSAAASMINTTAGASAASESTSMADAFADTANNIFV